MYYQTFRNKWKPGKRKAGELESGSFNHTEYVEVKDRFVATTSSDDDTETLPDLGDNPCAHDNFNTYKTSVWNVWKEQVEAKVNNREFWNQIWKLNCENLERLAKSRKNHIAKKNHHEKMTTHVEFFMAYDKDKLLEQEMWTLAQGSTNLRNAFNRIR